MEFRKLAVILFVTVCVGAQNQNVNPKLDFDGDNENSTDGRQYQGGTSPKIHGVRVSLDTGDGSKKMSRGEITLLIKFAMKMECFSF